jgi:hypothetical protein
VGPTLLFVAIDQGPTFASEVAHVTLIAALGNVGFGLTYAWTALRCPWYICAAAGVLVFGLVSWVLLTLNLAPGGALIVALVGLHVASRMMPKVTFVNPRRAVSAMELPVRCVAAGSLAGTVTILAAQLGPVGSGVLTIFPVMGMVLGVFSHMAWGKNGAIHLLTGILKGLYGFVLFCFLLAVTLPQVGTAASFGLALGAALMVHWLTFKWAR